MSRIVTHRKCDNCGYEYDGYWSYGHPSQDIHYDWKCERCGCVNHRAAKALPMGWHLDFIKLNDLENAKRVILWEDC